jgi:hypothetical protein
LPNSLIKRGVYRGNKNPSKNPETKSLHSRHQITQLFCPRENPHFASLLILSTITKVGESLWLKMLAFRSCQISQTVSKVRDAKPFRLGLGSSAKDDHHSWILSPTHCLGCTFTHKWLITWWTTPSWVYLKTRHNLLGMLTWETISHVG